MVAWLSATPLPGSDMAQWCGAVALAQASQSHFDYPNLIEAGYFTTFDSKFPPKESRASAADALVKIVLLEKIDPGWLDERKLDLVLEAPDNFFTELEKGEGNGTPRPTLQVHTRPGDERSRLAMRRLTPLLENWKHDLTKVRLVRKGLTEQFLDPVEVRQPEDSTQGAGRESVINLVVRFFPLMLVMWSLSGALYPAIDLCAGEKERGTMETLLITPAGREEIVLGKFLTIWVFSSFTALIELAEHGDHDDPFFRVDAAGGDFDRGIILVRGAVVAAVGVFQRVEPGDRRVRPQFEGRAVLLDAVVRRHDAVNLPDIGARRRVESRFTAWCP